MPRLLLLLALGSLFAQGVLAETPEAPIGARRVTLPGDQAGTALLWEETRGRLRGGVVLIPDLGTPADSPQVVRPLRMALPPAGWSVLVLEMPPEWGQVSDAEQRLRALEAAKPRIAAAVGHLRAAGIERIAIAGHGFGALAAADFLQGSTDPAAEGLVLIGLTSDPGSPGMDAVTILPKIPVPTLDVIGERDLTWVRQEAERRAAAARKALTERDGAEPSVRPERPDYLQVAVPGANRDFISHEQILARRVRGWLDRHLTGFTRPRPAANQTTATVEAPVDKEIPR